MASSSRQEEKAAVAKRGHLLPWGLGRERCTNGLRLAQMEVLRALCGGIIPLLPVAAGQVGDEDDEGVQLIHDIDKDMEHWNTNRINTG
ncbi:hypothetical protein ABZP36_005236 [Zizania latifolia]